MKNFEVVIAHPYKHHVYFLAKGVQAVCDRAVLLTPLYRKGVGRFLPLVPGSIGRKASGYFYDGLRDENVHAPSFWQMKKLASFISGHEKILEPYDSYVAKKINNKEINPKIFVTLQDYMPKSVLAAKKRGIHVWSDQITNQSMPALERIAKHEINAGKFRGEIINNEIINNEILKLADTITVPSSYCREGLVGRVQKNTGVHVVPYGADPNIFKFKQSNIISNGVVNIVARANSVRKGGHILLEAFELCGEDILSNSGISSVNVKIIGKYAPDMLSIIKKSKIHKNIKIEARDYAHNEIPSLLAGANLFIMPALSESMSLVCVEAMHVGLPLIVTKYVGVDAIKDGVMGYVCEDNAVSIAKALKNFFLRSSEWGNMSCASNSLASRLTWLNYENGISKIVKDLI